MATILRGLFVASRAPLRDATHARQWVSAGLALFAAVVVAAPPFKQTDWPTAKPPKSPPPNLVLAGSLPLTTARTLPFSATDWPLPRQTPESSIARKWERANDLPRQLQQTLPYALRDWPLANLPKSPPPNLTAPGSLSLTTFTGGPYAMRDWPLPRSADSPIARRWERANDLPRQLQTTLPFAQYAWPLAVRSLPSAPETPPVNTATIGTIVVTTAPFSQLDWPLPKGPLLDVPDLPPTNIVPTVGPAPFAAFDWPLAARPLPSAPETPPLNIAALRTIVVVTAPFAQLDWPLATTLKASAPETPPLNIAPLSVGPAPFASFDWSLARLIPPSSASRDTPPLNVAVINTIPVTVAAIEYIYFARRRTRK